MVKCSWSDSQSSSRDHDHVLMYSYIETAEAENTTSATRRGHVNRKFSVIYGIF